MLEVCVLTALLGLGMHALQGLHVHDGDVDARPLVRRHGRVAALDARWDHLRGGVRGSVGKDRNDVRIGTQRLDLRFGDRSRVGVERVPIGRLLLDAVASAVLDGRGVGVNRPLEHDDVSPLGFLCARHRRRSPGEDDLEDEQDRQPSQFVLDIDSVRRLLYREFGPSVLESHGMGH